MLQVSSTVNGRCNWNPARVQLLAPETEPAIFLCPSGIEFEQLHPNRYSYTAVFKKTSTHKLHYCSHRVHSFFLVLE